MQPCNRAPGRTSFGIIITNGREIWRDIEKKNLPLAVAGIAYYLLLSLFPALALLSAILSYLPVQNGLREAMSVLGYVIPSQVMTLIEEQLTRITPHRGALLSFGLVTTLWLASIAFKGLILGLDMVHGANVQRPLWLTRILALALTIAVGALLLIGVILTDRSRLVGSLLQAEVNRIAVVAARTIPPVVGVGVSSLHRDRTALCAGTQPTGIEACDDSWCRSRDCYLASVGLGTRFLFSSLRRAEVRQIFWNPGGSRRIHDLALLQRDRHPSRRGDQFKTQDRKRLRLLGSLP